MDIKYLKLLKSKFFLGASFLFFFNLAYAQSPQEVKDQAYALYATKNYNEAFQLLDNLPNSEKNEEVFLILANIAEENKNTNLAIKNLNKAIEKNKQDYKA